MGQLWECHKHGEPHYGETQTKPSTNETQMREAGHQKRPTFLSVSLWEQRCTKIACCCRLNKSVPNKEAQCSFTVSNIQHIALCWTEVRRASSKLMSFSFFPKLVGKIKQGVNGSRGWLNQMAPVQKLHISGLWGRTRWKNDTCSYILRVKWSL